MPDALTAAARKIGMCTLWESGLERVWDGTTSIEEVVRVLGERVQDDDDPTPAKEQPAPFPASVAAASVAGTPASPGRGAGRAAASAGRR